MVNRFHKLSLVSGSINEFPLWEAIFHGFKNRLMQGIFPSERVEGNQSGIQIDFASSQPMKPVFIDQRAFLAIFCLPFGFWQTINEPGSYAKLFDRVWQSGVRKAVAITH